MENVGSIFRRSLPLSPDNRLDLSRGRFSWQDLVVAVAATLLIIGLVRTAWLGDDALIIFRPVLNWLHGYGPVWNIRERVQVFTCPLWFLLITAATASTGEPFITTILLSIAVSLAAVAVLSISAWPGRLWGLALALVGLASSRGFVDFATSGLEAPLAYLLLALTMLELERQKPRDIIGFMRVSLLIALLLVTRLDLLFLLFPLALLAIGRCGRPRSVVLGGALGIVPLLAWYGFSLCYYGSVLPNTAYAKLGGGIAQIDMMRQGAHYVLYSLATDPIGCGLILAGLAIVLRDGNGESRALGVGIVAYLCYTIWVGGDFMVWRFIAVPVFASAILVSRSRIAFTAPFGVGTAACAIVVSWLAGAPYFSPDDFGPAYQTGSRGVVIERAWYFPAHGLVSPTRHFPDISGWEAAAPCGGQQPIPIEVEYKIGITGLEAGPCTHIIDVVGLADPLLARLPAIDVPNLRIGHLFRNVPALYQESIIADDNRLIDPAIHDLYTAVRLATRGPFWTRARWRAIGALALGRLNRSDAFVTFRIPPFVTHSLDPEVRAAPFGPLHDGIDTEYYRSSNYDVSMLEIDPIDHYQTVGWRDGRWPNTLFDPKYYVAHYSAEISDDTEPLHHYLTVGWRLGFNPSALFDTQSYLAHNPDVAAAGVNPMLHYLETGFKEKRQW